jgi:hypothetical protein
LTRDNVPEELDERRPRVARHGLSEHLAELSIQRGKERMNGRHRHHQRHQDVERKPDHGDVMSK